MPDRIAGFVISQNTGLPVSGAVVTPRASDGTTGTTGVTNTAGFVQIVGLADKAWTGTVASAGQSFQVATERVATDQIHGQSNTLFAHDFNQLRGKLVVNQITAESASFGKVIASDGAGNATWLLVADSFGVPVAQGDLLYGNAPSSLTTLPKDANATRYLSNQGTSNNPSWNQVNLANGVTGALPIANAGTNLTTYTTGDLLYASATNVLSKLGISTDGFVLTLVSGLPAWAAATGGSSYTDENAQDAIGAMVDASLVYVDATPLLTRAALTGDATASQGSNALTLATVNANVGAFGSATQVGQFTVNAKGLITAAANVSIALDAAAIVSGTLGVARGGTGLASWNIGDVAYASGTTTLAGLRNTAATAKFLQETGTGAAGQAPVWFDLFGTVNTWSAAQTFSDGATFGNTTLINSAVSLRFGTGNQRIVGTSPQLDIVADAASSILNLGSSGTSGVLNLLATTTTNLKIAGTAEVSLTADKLSFNNGTTDTYLGWGTDGQLDFGVDATSEMSLADDTLTFENGTYAGWRNADQFDIGIGGGVPGEYFTFTQVASGADTKARLNFRTWNDDATAFSTSYLEAYNSDLSAIYRMDLSLNGGVYYRFGNSSLVINPGALLPLTISYSISAASIVMLGSLSVQGGSFLNLQTTGKTFQLDNANNSAIWSDTTWNLGFNSISPSTLNIKNLGGTGTINLGTTSTSHTVNILSSSVVTCVSTSVTVGSAVDLILNKQTASRMLYIDSSKKVTSNAALTSTRVPFADSNGFLADDADMTFVTDTLSVTKISTSQVTNSGLTSGRVVVASTAGLLADDSDLTFSGSTLTATNVAVTTKLTCPELENTDTITIDANKNATTYVTIDNQNGTANLVLPRYRPGKVASPAAGNYVRMGGVLNTTEVNVGNVGAGEDDLMTYTLKANTGIVEGDLIEIVAYVSFAGNANNKTVKVYFGTAISALTLGPTIQNGGAIAYHIFLRRGVASTDHTGHCIEVPSGVLTILGAANATSFSSSGTDWAADQVIKFTGTGTADNDVVQSFMHIRFWPATA